MLDRRKYYDKWRNKVINHLGGKCVGCGSTESLQCHHIDPETKSYELSTRWGFRWDSQIEEIEKCELRCDPCHKKQHESLHGINGYSHRKCRCDICREAWNSHSSAYKKQWRAKKREGASV